MALTMKGERVEIRWKNDYLVVHVARGEDGAWTYGHMSQYTPLKGGRMAHGAGISASGISFQYGPKFSTAADAIREGLKKRRDEFVHPQMLKIIDDKIAFYTPLQLSLWA
jgi:hypothetical protein